MQLFTDPVVAGTVLVRAAIQSADFAPGSAGWQLNQDGSAELNDVTIRGGEIISGTELDYNGTPAAGNLIYSRAAAADTDDFGNHYLAGVTSYLLIGPGGVYYAINLNQGLVSIYTATAVSGPWTFYSSSGAAQFPAFGAISAVQSIFPATVLGSVSNPLAAAVYGPSGDATGATDAFMISELLKMCGTVLLLGGVYYIDGPLNPPPYGLLAGLAPPMSLDLTPAQVTSAPRIIAVASWAPSSATGMLQFLSQTPGGWSAPAQSQAARNLILDCSGNASANLSPVLGMGPAYDVHLDDILAYGGHDGINTVSHAETGITPVLPYHWRVHRVSCVSQTFRGFNLANTTDSVFESCLGFACANECWFISGCANSTFTACRGEWSQSASGLHITGNVRGTVIFAGFSTDHNATEGVLVDTATIGTTDGCGIVFSGKLHADMGATGFKVTGSTCPVTITGTNIEVGQNGAAQTPGTALAIDTSTAVAVSGSILQGQASAWSWDGLGAVARSGCIGAAGNPGAQVFTRLADI